MTSTQLQIQKVNFQGTTLLAAQDKEQKIWVGISFVCNGIGLNKSQKDTQIQNVQTDLVLKRGCLKFQAGVFDPNNETIAIMIDYLPLWLAKISITPRMQRETPELVEKLINYQLKAKDFLAAAFLPPQYQPQSPNPLLEQSIMSLQQSQQNLINCTMEQGYQLANHEEQLESIQNCIQYDLLHADKMDEISETFLNLESQIAELKNIQVVPITPTLQGRQLLHSIIQPLAEKYNDGSMGYNATYRKVYVQMDVNWKYRITRFANQHEGMKKPNKIDLVSADDKLREMFKQTVVKMLQEI